MRKILLAIATAGMIAGLFLFGVAMGTAHAQVAGNYWYPTANYLTPVVSSWGLKVPAIASTTSGGCLTINSSGIISTTGSACGGGGGGVYPFTPSFFGSTAVSATSTPILDYPGLISSTSTVGDLTATSTLNVTSLITGLVFSQSGRILSQATSSASAASASVWRDANQNAFAQNFVSAATTFPTNGGTVTLTAASPRTWIFTGSSNETMKLPNGTTLSVGATYQANNNSSGVITIVDNGSNVLTTVPSGGSRVITIYDVSTSNGSWDSHGYLGHKVYSGYNNLSVGSSTPFAELAVHANPNDSVPYTTLFAIASSTSGATTTLFSINNIGTITTNYGTGCVLSTSGVLSVTGSGCNSGTVTSITAGTGLTGGTITNSGTIALASYLATSSAETSGRVPFWTSTSGTPANLSGGSANFTWNNTTNNLAFMFGSSTALTATSLFGTNAAITFASSTAISASGQLYVPNSSSPTPTGTGSVAVNTSVASSSIQYNDGSAQQGLYATTTSGFTFNNYPTFGTGTTTQIILNGGRGFKITSAGCTSVGGTANAQLGNGTASTTMLSSTQTLKPTLTYFTSNNTFDDYSPIFLAIGTFSSSGTTTVSCYVDHQYTY